MPENVFLDHKKLYLDKIGNLRGGYGKFDFFTRETNKNFQFRGFSKKLSKITRILI